MTTRQKILQFFYPVFVAFSRLAKKKSDMFYNPGGKEPIVPFYSLSFTGNDGKQVSFEQYRGRKVVLVNTASFCGYTSQYDALEQLYKDNKDRMVVLGFPANNFGAQEPGSDAEIAQFCRVNYGVGFPLFKKSSVLPPDQNAVYTWLSDPAQNGWNDQLPRWNFYKYIVDEQGRLTHVFGSAIAPDGAEMKKALGS
jgi:glutathione peroxidase